MHLEHIALRAVHAVGDILPVLKAQVPQFQQRLKLRVIHGFHHLHDVPLQIHQPVNVSIDLCLHIDDLRNHVLHAVNVPGVAHYIIAHD